MQNETTQPLGEQPTRSTDDTRLVAEVLGGEAAADMNELVGDQAKTSIKKPDGLEMSTEEASAIEHNEQIREERIRKFSDWVDLQETPFTNPKEFFKARKFIFNNDGTVDVLSDLNLIDRPYRYLPDGLNHVTGSCLLGATLISDLSNLPRIINGDLNLQNIKATTIPEGIEVGGEVYINTIQTELIKDANAKGYTVLKM